MTLLRCCCLYLFLFCVLFGLQDFSLSLSRLVCSSSLLFFLELLRFLEEHHKQNIMSNIEQPEGTRRALPNLFPALPNVHLQRRYLPCKNAQQTWQFKQPRQPHNHGKQQHHNKNNDYDRNSMQSNQNNNDNENNTDENALPVSADTVQSRKVGSKMLQTPTSMWRLHRSFYFHHEKSGT